MKLKLSKVLQNKKLLISIVLIMLLILVGVGYFFSNRITNQQSAVIITPHGTITNTADEPIRPDVNVIITEDGFFEELVEYSTVNDPVNATILIRNMSSSSASITITTPEQKTIEPISLEPQQEEVYFAELFGAYVINNTITNQVMQVILQKE